MQWINTSLRRRRFRSGRAPWTSASSPHSTSWRWPARPFNGFLGGNLSKRLVGLSSGLDRLRSGRFGGYWRLLGQGLAALATK